MKFTTDNAKAKYEASIIASLVELQNEFKALGFEVSDIQDWSDEEYAWDFVAEANGKIIGIDLYLTEEKIREGSGKGLAFHLSIVASGGEILGDYAPYNYSPLLWCYDWADLDVRMESLNGMGLGEDVIQSLKEHAGL